MTKGHGSAVSKICFASEGDDRVLLTAGLGDGRVNVFDMRTSQLVKAAVVAKAAINVLDMANHSNGNHIVTGSADHMIKLFDMRAGEGKNLSRVRQIKVQEPVLCGDIIPGGDLLVVGGGKGNLYTYDIQQGG